jgi:fructose-1,6-bisphosphatase
VKEKGVFTNVTSPSTKAKLRILFEVAPLALLVCPCRPLPCMQPFNLT